MTISTTVNRIAHLGNGSTVAFSFPYYFLLNGDLKVYQNDVLKTITTHYSVSGAGVPAGGTVTFVTAPALNDEIVIVRDPPATQETDYLANDPFPAESHERALDKLTMLLQRAYDRISRAFGFADSSTTTASTTVPDPTAGYLLGWNGAGTALENVNPADLADIIVSGSYSHQTFTGDGTTTAFTLSSTPGNISNLDVSINGVVQVPVLDYTIAGVTLTFSAAPVNAAVVLARWGDTVISNDSDAASIMFTQQGTGAVVRSVANKFYDMVSVSDFGAVCDGVTNDANALIAAINTGKHVALQQGTLLANLSTSQVATFFNACNRLHIYGDEMNIVCADGEYSFANQITFDVENGDRLSIAGTTVQVTSITALVSITSNATYDHDVVVTVASATNIAIGDYVVIRSGLAGTGDFMHLGGCWAITGVSGTNITFKCTDARASFNATTMTAGSFRVFKTRLKFTTSSIGFDIYGNLGSENSTINKLCLIGNGSGANAVGMYHELTAQSYFGSDFGLNGFGSHGIYLLGACFMWAQSMVVSNSGENGIYLLGNSTATTANAITNGNHHAGQAVTNGSTASSSSCISCGNGQRGYYITFSSNAIAVSAYIDGNTSQNVELIYGSSGDFSNSTITNGAANGVLARHLCYANLTGATISGNASGQRTFSLSSADETNFYTANFANASTFASTVTCAADLVIRNAFTGNISLADDAATSVTIGTTKTFSILLICTTSSDTALWGWMRFSTAATAQATALTVGSNIAVTTGALTGTTGTDTQYTVSAANDGKLYFENRRGGTRAINYILFGDL